VLETQYPNGNIPNWRSRSSGTPDRSQPPVGAYVVLKLFGKLGDMDLLTMAFPYLTKWHAFWKAPQPDGRPRRDGNADGLLEWGSDTDLVAGRVPSWEEKATGKQRAMWESGQDDLPNWEEAAFDESRGTLTMNCLDLNCLYALDAYCLAQIANILNRPADYAAYLQEYEDMRQLINDQLWSERAGFYFDRYWDGRFSSRKAASNFYPLLARIPDARRASLLVSRRRTIWFTRDSRLTDLMPWPPNLPRRACPYSSGAGRISKSAQKTSIREPVKPAAKGTKAGGRCTLSSPSRNTWISLPGRASGSESSTPNKRGS
jgi:hypothetical protein